MEEACHVDRQRTITPHVSRRQQTVGPLDPAPGLPHPGANSGRHGPFWLNCWTRARYPLLPRQGTPEGAGPTRPLQFLLTKKRRKKVKCLRILLAGTGSFCYDGRAAAIEIPYLFTTYLSGGHVTFEIGDKVIYPNHGLGVIERIEDEDHHRHHLRLLSASDGRMKPRCSCRWTTSTASAFAAPSTTRRSSACFDLLGDGKIDSHQNWKGRFKDNSDRMRTGSIYDVVEVLKSLTFLAKSKSLSFREKRMLDRAKFLVVSEISEVMREPSVMIESRVDKALDRSLATKSRMLARPKTAIKSMAASAPRRAIRAS